MNAVTVAPKCYVIKCLGCDRYDLADRTDKATCSTRCRVRVHRAGILKQLLDECPHEVNAGGMARANALADLCPELLPRLMDGSLRIESTEARRAALQAFFRLLDEETEQEAR